MGWFRGAPGGDGFGPGVWGFELMGAISCGNLMAGNFWRALWAWVICFGITTIVTFLTSRSQKTDEELQGLVWGLTEKKEAVEPYWYKRPWDLAAAALREAVEEAQR